MSDLHEMAEAARRGEDICPGCNNNRSYLIGEVVIECTKCKPETHAAIKKLQQEMM